MRCGFNKEWLPHLTSEVIANIEGNYLDAYVVALEGWRRGLTLKWHVKDCTEFKDIKTWSVDYPGQLFSLHSKDKSHYFFRTRGDLVSLDAVEQGMNKDVTKQMLKAAGVPVPEGKQFTEADTIDEIINYISKLQYPVVIKPTDGSFGRGVFSDIRSEAEVHRSLDYIRNVLHETDIIVEKHMTGKDYRIYVVGNEVVGAILRVPPNVVGDGVNTIESLIAAKNKKRQLNPRLTTCPIIVNEEMIHYINRYGYTLDSVPEKDQVVYMSDKGNVSIGGDPVDVLDDLSEDVKKIAVQALKAVSNFPHGAVDIISKENKTGYVLELNPTAQIGGILFPLKGQPRDVPKAIIDYYFPETKENPTQHAIYFDYQEALLPLVKSTAEVTTVTQLPKAHIHRKRFLIYGDVHDLPFQQMLRKEAVDREIIGSIKLIDQSYISMVLAGTSINIAEYQTSVLEANSQITSIKVERWKAPMKIGFEIIGARQSVQHDLRTKQQEITKLQNKQAKLRKEYNNMLNSTSWKITRPIRTVTGLIKSILK